MIFNKHKLRMGDMNRMKKRIKRQRQITRNSSISSKNMTMNIRDASVNWTM